MRNASRGDEEVDYLLSHGLVGKTVQLSLNDKQAAAERDRQQSSAHQARTQTERTAIWQGYTVNQTLSRPMQAAYAELYPELYHDHQVPTAELSALLYPGRVPATLAGETSGGTSGGINGGLISGGLSGGISGGISGELPMVRGEEEGPVDAYEREARLSERLQDIRQRQLVLEEELHRDVLELRNNASQACEEMIAEVKAADEGKGWGGELGERKGGEVWLIRDKVTVLLLLLLLPTTMLFC